MFWRILSSFHVFGNPLPSNLLSQAAAWFVSNKMVLSEFNVVACDFSLICLFEAALVVGAFFVYPRGSSYGLYKFPLSISPYP